MMRVQHECRSGEDRRKFDLAAIAPIPVNRRWTKDQRSYVVDEEWKHGSETAVPEEDWTSSQSASRW